MKKLIQSAALLTGLFFLTVNTIAQTAVAVKTPAKATAAAIKDTTHSPIANTVTKSTIPDPIAAVTNQGKEEIIPVIIAPAKLPAGPDQGKEVPVPDATATVKSAAVSSQGKEISKPAETAPVNSRTITDQKKANKQ